MHATQLLFLLLGASTWATPLHKRDAATVLIDLYNIKTDLAALSTTLDGFYGTLNGAVDVEYAEIDLEDSLNKGINDVVASATFAAASSTRITNSVTGLEPDILAILDKLGWGLERWVACVSPSSHADNKVSEMQRDSAPSNSQERNCKRSSSGKDMK